jgi:hypothetical protein
MLMPPPVILQGPVLRQSSRTGRIWPMATRRVVTDPSCIKESAGIAGALLQSGTRGAIGLSSYLCSIEVRNATARRAGWRRSRKPPPCRGNRWIAPVGPRIARTRWANPLNDSISPRHCEKRSDEAIHSSGAEGWIASRSLSSGRASRGPARWHPVFPAPSLIFEGGSHNSSGASARREGACMFL